jgi:GNAT superfamily N-acetyltransferase
VRRYPEASQPSKSRAARSTLAPHEPSTRPELTGLGWPEKQQDAFTRMQSGAQARHYREACPDAIYSVICVDGEPAGRLITSHGDDQILIIDIALLPEFRRTGIGSDLVRRLLDQADAGRLPVRCHVLHDSTARRFWEHAGFAAQGSDGVYVAMERAPQARPP